MNAQDVVERCKKLFKYKSLPPATSEYVREFYTKELPDIFKDKIDGGSYPLFSKDGYLVCNGFERIVIGDYGAYVEFNFSQANTSQFIIMPGQEYRTTEKYKNSKFFALTHEKYASEKGKDIYHEHSLLIYHQKQTVTYADYRIGYYYVSVYQLFER